MPAIGWMHDGRRIHMRALILPPSPGTDLTGIEVKALVDTGSTVSGIAKRFAKGLGLEPKGKLRLMSAHGLGAAEQYLFRIGIPSPPADKSTFPFVFDDLMGFELLDGSEIDAILGMDILKQCDLAITRDRRCTFSFGKT